MALQDAVPLRARFRSAPLAYVGLSFGLLAWAGRLLLPELWIEQFYSRGLFVVVRSLIDYTFGWLPFPSLYLFVGWLLYLAAKGVYRWRAGEGHIGQKLKGLLIWWLGFLGWGVFLFLLLWGYNYSRLPIEQELGLQLKPLSTDELRRAMYQEADALKVLRAKIPGAGTEALGREHFPENLEEVLRAEQEAWLHSHGYPAPGRVRGKLIYPKGVFLRFSSAGLYFPWTGEGHVDAGLHPIQQVGVMAHEMGHGFGFGDEGTCNFLAYVTCFHAADPAIAYAGRLDYWRTLAANYLRVDRDGYRTFRESLPLGIQADLDAINATLMAYPDILPSFRYLLYNSYLKAQGIEEGIQNYNRVLMLVKAWKEGQQI